MNVIRIEIAVRIPVVEIFIKRHIACGQVLLERFVGSTVRQYCQLLFHLFQVGNLHWNGGRQRLTSLQSSNELNLNDLIPGEISILH